MSSAQKFKELLKKRSEKADDPSISSKWVQDVAKLYKIIGEWLHEEGIESFINPRSFEDQTIGEYDSAIMSIKAGESEATITPQYTVMIGTDCCVNISSGKESRRRVIGLDRRQIGDETHWGRSGGRAELTKSIFFDVLIKVFRLEE